MRWDYGDGVGADPIITQSQIPSAAEAMMLYESHGIRPDVCSDPALLVRYMRGKRWRDWHIEQYRIGLAERTIFPAEVLASPLDEITVRKLIRESYIQL